MVGAAVVVAVVKHEQEICIVFVQSVVDELI